LGQTYLQTTRSQHYLDGWGGVAHTGFLLLQRGVVALSAISTVTPGSKTFVQAVAEHEPPSRQALVGRWLGALNDAMDAAHKVGRARWREHDRITQIQVAIGEADNELTELVESLDRIAKGKEDDVMYSVSHRNEELSFYCARQRRTLLRLLMYGDQANKHHTQ
jgi:hypothetical protein